MNVLFPKPAALTEFTLVGDQCANGGTQKLARSGSSSS